MARTGTRYEGEYEHCFQEIPLITSEAGVGAMLPEAFATYQYVVDDFGDVCNFDLIDVEVPVYAADGTKSRFTIRKNDTSHLALIIAAISSKKFEDEAIDGLLETEFDDVVFRNADDEHAADYRASVL